MNSIFLLGIFGLPRYVSEYRRSVAIKLAAIGVGVVFFGYVRFGATGAAAVGFIPAPAATLGPVATLSLTDGQLAFLMRLMNSLATGPFLVAAVGYAMNRIMTHPEVTEIPILHYTLPRRDPWEAVAVSAALGTTFYLLFVGAFTGRLLVVP
jgi:hypothetical protein